MTPDWSEKRKSRRHEIIDQFSFYVCVPKLGWARHKVSDISDSGIRIEIETLGEFRLALGETTDLLFYMNQSLHLSLQIEVVRQTDHGSVQQVGATFRNPESDEQKTFTTLVKLVDQLSEFGKS
jgi:hypothetical protein